MKKALLFLALSCAIAANTQTIEWCNIQYPASGTVNPGEALSVYARVFSNTVTNAVGQGANIEAQIGYSVESTDPALWTNGIWVNAVYVNDDGSNDEYKGDIKVNEVGTYYYASRFRYNGGAWKYGGYNAGFWDGATNVSGQLTIIDNVAPLDLYYKTGWDTSKMFVIHFNEKIKAGTGNILIKNYSTDAIAQTIDIASPDKIKIYDSTLVIKYSGLTAATTYYITMISGVIEDLSTNDYAGNSNKEYWKFTCHNYIYSSPPTAWKLSPNKIDTVVRNPSFGIFFNKAIVKDTGYFRIKKTSDNSEVATISMNSDKVIVTDTSIFFSLYSLLEYNTSYYIITMGGLVTDYNGARFNNITDNTVWTFTTQCVPVAPVVTAFKPLDKSENIAVDSALTIVFNQPVMKGKGLIKIIDITAAQMFQTIDAAGVNIKDSGNKIIIMHDVFDHSRKYGIVIDSGAIKNTAGIAYKGLAQESLWTFTSAALITDPIAESIYPQNNSKNIPLDSNLVITFDQDIVKGTGSIIIKDSATNIVLQDIDMAAAAVVINKKIATIHFTGLQAGRTYYVTIPAGAFRNSLNNPFAGFSFGSWKFSTIVKSSLPDNYVAVSVFPNPMIDQAQLALPESSCNIEIINSLGQVVREISKASNIVTIEKGSMSEGLYFVKIKGEKTYITRLIVK